jgi:hypothetical protein
MANATDPQNQAVEYRYFVCDLMTNDVLAEVPFKSVSYSRTINEAGSFSGDVPMTEDTYNLSIYENTLPGKTALYVVRNGVCVWGGIIWGTYSLVDKIVSIDAGEFNSYFSRRVVWKTWNSSYQASAVVSSGTATITLDQGQYDFQAGEVIWIDWGTELAKYTGYFTVVTVGLTVDDRSEITVAANYVDVSGSQKTIPDQTVDGLLTVETRQDTHEFVLDLLEELKTDLFDFDFANDEIRPGVDLFNYITSVARSSNVATIVTDKKQELVPGQKIVITDVGSGFDDPEATVKAIVDDYTFTYDNTGSDVSTITLSDTIATITAFSRTSNVATFTTNGAHGLGDGDIVLIENVSETFDGYRTVYGTPPSSTQFQTVIIGSDIATSYTDSTSSTFPPRVIRGGAVTYGTYGEHTTKGDIGIDLTQADGSSGVLEANPEIRGYQLRTVQDILQEYQNKPNGFEYRVDCEYDAATDSFKKYFKVIPVVPPEVQTYMDSNGVDGNQVPPSVYGADNFIFEYPGNVLEAQFEETADDSASRTFVQGKDSRLSSDASQPYSSATNYKLLRQGWPILDEVDDIDSSDETVLWRHAVQLMKDSIPPSGVFVITVNGSANPEVGTYNPGDWCSVILNDDFVTLRAQSNYEQDFFSDSGALIRKILSFSVSVPDTPSYPEEVSIELVAQVFASLTGAVSQDGKVFNGD